eukprot:TRINITY_DN99784_c0_g1_i1.p1 TRINITY_DN99784_c0_g1~~TRINITY_DN99784_c0_g1_i1.p1  ORF type:complete len:145 (+),score=39.44 TRINITY_DN99784_c0_g1_i1:113-547(+)
MEDEYADEGAMVAQQEEEITDLDQAIKKVIKMAMINDGLAKGLNEVALAIEQKEGGKGAKVVFLAESVDEQGIKSLVEGLCKEKSVPIVNVPTRKTLGEWCGLCKLDKDGLPRKVVGASCVAVKNYGEETEAHAFLMKHLEALK